MGQKVNPNSFRIGIIKGWQSNWVARSRKEYAAYVQEDQAIRNYLQKNYPRELLGNIIIHRTLKMITVTLQTPRPPLLIGNGGDLMAKHTKALKKICSQAIQIQVKQIKKPDLNARLVAEQVASKITGRMNYKRVARQAITNTRRMGAEGIKVMFSGRLAGAEIARSEFFQEGRLPRQTIRADLDYASVQALTTYGIIGIKVWIFVGEVYGKRNLSLIMEPQRGTNASILKKKPS